MSDIPLYAGVLLSFGIVLHLFADWFLQSDWMAKNKPKRRIEGQPSDVRLVRLGPLVFGEGDEAVYEIQRHPASRWWDRHPAAYVHAGIHGLIQLLIFPWWAALAIAVTHFLIDLRSPLDWWGKFTRQTRPALVEPVMPYVFNGTSWDRMRTKTPVNLMDIGMGVAWWRDQTAHFVVLAILALVAS